MCCPFVEDTSSSGEPSSSGRSSFSQSDELRQKRMAQTEAATVTLAVEFLGMAAYYLEEELVTPSVTGHDILITCP
jgi:hypothetical protein